MIDSLRSGTVIIDLAAATGGNTPYTQNNQTIERNGVTIVGNSSLFCSMPADASKLYGKNVINFLQLLLTKEGQLHLNFNDELVKGCCITHEGQIVHERLK
jgi:NAD(P) transhydrogenase subunit alpha